MYIENNNEYHAIRSSSKKIQQLLETIKDRQNKMNTYDLLEFVLGPFFVGLCAGYRGPGFLLFEELDLLPQQLKQEKKP